MDPVSAIGLAASAVALLDYNQRSLRRAKEISGPGELRDMLDGLRDSINQLAELVRFTHNLSPELESDLYNVADEIMTTSKELEELLANSIGAKKIARFLGLERRLRISAFTKPETLQTSARLHELDPYSRAAVEALVSQHGVGIIHDDSPLLASAGRLVNSVQGPEAPTRSPLTQAKPLSEAQIRQQTEETLLQLLSYNVMFDRHDEIAQVVKGSFEWVFEEEPRGQSWSSFPSWLRNGSGLYWINGIEASGKSTMMKYIYNNTKTQEQLNSWAKDMPLAPAAYFFWRSGSRLERSQEGLLRSLLHTIFSSHPHLMASVLPHEWAAIYSWRSDPAGAEDPGLGAWETGKLREAFRRLLTQQQAPLKLFFLIDGLDEYEDGNVDEIIELFTKDVAASPNAKALVSSRPLVALSAMDISNLTLHCLNQNDIRAYLHLVLETAPRFTAAADADSESALSLIQYILDTSGGLFLWAVLVVRRVRDSFADGTSLKVILDALKERLPPVLDSVYDQTWQNIRSEDRQEASQILQVVLAARAVRRDWAGTPNGDEPLTLLDLALAKGDPQDIVEEIKPWGVTRIRDTCRPVAESFMAKWPGLITLGAGGDKAIINPKPGARIRYAHRSALDYLQRADTKALLREATSPTQFCPFLAHVKAHVQHLRIMCCSVPPEKARDELWTAANLALVAANQAEASVADETKSSAYNQLLDQLDLTMTHHHKALYKDDHGQWIQKTIRSSRGELEKSGKGRDSRRRAEMHWSNFSATFSHPQSWEDSFLSLAVQFGLRQYVANALATGLGKKDGRPLLYYALDPLPIAQTGLITPTLVDVLLAHDSKLGRKFEHQTPWQNALAWQYNTYVDGKGRAIGGATEAREVAELRLRIVLLLIERGADVRAAVALPPARMLPARKVLVDAFQPWTKAESFQELIGAFDEAVAAAESAGLVATFKRLLH